MAQKGPKKEHFKALKCSREMTRHRANGIELLYAAKAYSIVLTILQLWAQAVSPLQIHTKSAQSCEN